MKRILGMAAVAALGFLAGTQFKRCGGHEADIMEPDGTFRDTVTFVDTIPYFLPTPAKESALGTRLVFVPVVQRGNNDTMNIPPKCNIEGENIPDSVAVEIPITQREYEAEEYRAWVSGYDPRLDSIFVYPRRETVRETVTLRAKEPPDRKGRWGIGPTVGYGYTPAGWQPYLGVSVTYNIVRF